MLRDKHLKVVCAIQEVKLRMWPVHRGAKNTRHLDPRCSGEMECGQENPPNIKENILLIVKHLQFLDSKCVFTLL